MGLTREEAERCGIGHLFHEPETTIKPSKYRAVRTVYKGVPYPSKAEAARAAQLDLWASEAPGRWWIGQPVFRLGVPENVYRADFLVVSPDGVVAEDVKGVETAKFRRDKKLWAAYGPCPLRVIKGKSHEVILPKPA